MSPDQSPSTGAEASRFYTRWINADPARAEQIGELKQSPLTPALLDALLRKETEAGMPLPRAMRRVRNLAVASLIARDLDGQADLHEVVTGMSMFADFAVKRHLDALMAEMTSLYGMPVGQESGRPQELIVVGMGKLGGYELNVSSDIDLIFVYPEGGETQPTEAEQRQLSNHEFFVRLGKKLIGALSEITEDGFTFRVDMALRPNGGSGPLAASLAMVEEYFIVQGREWERYAWLKARAMTGQAEDIAALQGLIRPFVYRRYLDYGAIDAIRNMHAQIRAEVIRQETRHPDRSHNVKLGRGGIREIEFLAQVFQLIRGGRDAELRDRSTRSTLNTLDRKGLLKPEAVRQMLDSYTFLRNLEHRLQYLDDAQTHTLPANDEDRTTVARTMGYADAAELLEALGRHQAQVAAQFDAIFSDRKGENATDGNGSGDKNADGDPNPAWQALLSSDDGKDAVESHLAALGYDDPAASAQRLLATWQSTRLNAMPEASRQKLVALVSSALPAIASLTHEHTATLGRFLDFLQAIARRASYLSLLTEYPHTLGRVLRMMAASDWAATYLTRHPLLLDELLDDRTISSVPDWPAFIQECRRQLDEAAGDQERQVDILRETHHAQLFRLLAQDLEGRLTVERLADHLSALADALVAVTLNAVWSTLQNRHRETPRFAVIAYGKLGGKELGYASDLDVVFLYEDEDPEAPANYARLAQRFITWMTSHTAAGILFDIDIALRPDGASGLLVSSFAAFQKYQSESAWLWEHQALTRARFCAGDAAIGEKFEKLRIDVLCQARDEAALKREILSMRARMHEAHPNRTTSFDLKHDAGGMIDIEFMVQYLVLRHASQHTQLAGDIGNIALLKLCGELGLIDSILANQVADAYRAFRRLQHQIRMQGHDRARVEQEAVAGESATVKALWGFLFGDQV